MAGVGDILGEIGKGAVGAGKGAANWLTDVIFKNPVEVLKNPASILNDRGEVSVTRLLFPDFRRQRVAEQESFAQAQQARAQAQALAAYGDIAKMFMDAPTDTAQGELRKGLVEQGIVDEDMSRRLGAAAKSGRHESRQAGAQVGLMPEVANLATPDTARQAGQSQFTDRLAREQNVQQAGLTRGNQANAASLAAGNIKLRDRLAREREAAKPKEQDADAAFVQNVLSDPAIAANPNALTPQLRDTLAIAAKSGGEAAKMAAKKAFEQLTQGAVTPNALPKLINNEFGRSLLKASQSKAMNVTNLEAMEKFRAQPNLFATGAGLQATAESLAESTFGRAPSKFTKDRVALQQAAGAFGAAYVQGISGATVPEAEYQRLSNNFPNLERDGYSSFFVKLDAMKAAESRDKELVDKQIQAIVDGNLEAFQALSVERGNHVSRLATQLEDLSPLSEEDLQYLTPLERAELGR